ncbi:hypothetical protein [Nocardia aurantia]|uniref:Uncharacterized protein n=1 Tax=Nocardia aurantia TaxID=2585199 RepID=A0A7K0E0X2_9NOCA|nr:hypothetical protein [Nocardia aurantia]MQY31723.1 hypothetical protein [Nocardia aurantia]
MTVLQKLTVGMIAAIGVAGVVAVGSAQATSLPVRAVDATWVGPGCVPVAVQKYSDGSVWGIENCGGLEQRVLLGHS